jgi:hypothetical protein
MRRSNKHRNRQQTIKLDLKSAVSYNRWKFRENRKGVFNITRERIRKTYIGNDDLN